MLEGTKEMATIGYKGYILYDDIELELSRKYYGTSTNSSDNSIGEDGYVYKYIRDVYDIESKDIEGYYEKNKDFLDIQIKTEFEQAIRNDEVDIFVGDGIKITEVSEYNRDYACSVFAIEENRNSINMNRGVNSGDDTNLNTVIAEYKEESIMFIEGTNSQEDIGIESGDWSANFDMAINVSAEKGKSPKVYLDAYDYYQEHGQSVTSIVGNSQGGGSAIYIGMQDPNVKVVALSPSPQYVGDIELSGDYSNITIVYNSTDILHHASKEAGFITELPGANIVHVEYGLNKFINLGEGSLFELLWRDINAGHTGDASAVDFNTNGVIDSKEINLGIDINNVVPRSVFTGEIIGSNTIKGEQLIMDAEHMIYFSNHIGRMASEITEIDMRNNIAKRDNSRKMTEQDKKVNVMVTKTTEDVSNYVQQKLFGMAEIGELISDVLTRPFLNSLSDLLNELPQILGLHETRNFYSNALRLVANFDNLFRTGNNSFILSGMNIIDSINNPNRFYTDVRDVVQDIVRETLRTDYVGHKGKNAIHATLDIVLNSFSREIDNLKSETISVQRCSKYLSTVFDEADQVLSKQIIDGESIGNLSRETELTLSSQTLYQRSLGVLSSMNIINQYERLIDDGTNELTKFFQTIIVAIVDILNWVIANKVFILNILDYEVINTEINIVSERIQSQIDAINKTPYNMVASPMLSVEKRRLETQKISLLSIRQLIERLIKPNQLLFSKIETVLDKVEETLAEISNIDQILISYIEPRIKSMLYDTNDLGVVRDTVKLNSQVLKRFKTEIVQARNTLNSSVSFIGKEAFTELVLELELRASALSMLHQDVFGDQE